MASHQSHLDVYDVTDQRADRSFSNLVLCAVRLVDSEVRDEDLKTRQSDLCSGGAGRGIWFRCSGLTPHKTDVQHPVRPRITLTQKTGSHPPDTPTRERSARPGLQLHHIQVLSAGTDLIHKENRV